MSLFIIMKLIVGNPFSILIDTLFGAVCAEEKTRGERGGFNCHQLFLCALCVLKLRVLCVEKVPTTIR